MLHTSPIPPPASYKIRIIASNNNNIVKSIEAHLEPVAIPSFKPESFYFILYNFIKGRKKL